ncbi:hypothetical protein FKZ61_001380 [Litorilinea aerophila]|uniref:Uncharacterized protein n=1 Tax=Litorilinea aerophila TaxID=1204385 RepID=A0A540VLE7_9CHLR|nr:hypothetical protein [Litorilinea aerophila]MCC9074768.1 hypothetical protein [Litorilinea aerophila]OUC09239.1 hypothetical protein RY27_04050 [Litorilinea aerophila]GIV77910.1 MAG: hypothetical protein KatS3mg050_2304 [Litorilinea sp.]
MNRELALALLRRYEPILRFTRGERFFPMDVEPYVRACSLWVQRPGEDPFCLVERGRLDLERLSQPHPAEFGTVHYLKFTDPLSVTQLAAYTWQQSIHGRDEEEFRPGPGRLARVGYFPRLIDAFFTLGLLARGRVPGDAAAAAAQAYRQLLAQGEGYRYHGRVIEQNGWVVLQYWFFYAFNNWRSAFFGANDHEGDWEMLNIYLYQARPPEAGETLAQAAERYRPEWVAYASHDYQGDDLRRRWDDPELEKVGGHPVVYVSAGSHASYYSRGEYLTEIELPFLAPLARVSNQLRHVWHEWLRQYRPEEEAETPPPDGNIFRIPFVDYARGDGISIGPGESREWDPPHLLTPPPAWVTNYRGLWGLYTRDPFAGEDAPAGPMYNRDGSVRRAWYDPVGWAGLDKVAPPRQQIELAVQRQDTLRIHQVVLQEEIEHRSRELHQLGMEAAAMRTQPHLHRLYQEHQRRIAELSAELDQLRAQAAQERALLAALEQHEARLRAGDRGPAREHIRRAHRPASEQRLRLSRLAEIWAAVSISVTMVGFVALVYLARHYLVFGLTTIIALFTFIEAGFRGQLLRLVVSLTIGLAVVASLVLLYEFFWQVITLTVLVVGLYIMWENLRELRQ